MQNIYTGNANTDGTFTRQWIVGRFMPDNDIRHTDDLEIKWGNHPQGDARDEWVTGETRTTVCILVSGSFILEFPNQQVKLQTQGDYVMWAEGTGHRWHAEEDSVIVTIRWPSKT